jgi:transposase
VDTHSQDTTIAGPAKPIVKRRQYSNALKRQIVEECLAGNDSASVVARRHDINANLLFKWRRQYDAGALGNEPGATALVPIVVKPPAQTRSPAPAAPDSGDRSNTGNLEICLATGHRLVVTGGVCSVALRTALEVLSA